MLVDLMSKIPAHLRYLKRVEATCAGNDNFDGLTHNECKFGEWYYSEGAAQAESFSPFRLHSQASAHPSFFFFPRSFYSTRPQALLSAFHKLRSWIWLPDAVNTTWRAGPLRVRSAFSLAPSFSAAQPISASAGAACSLRLH